MSWRLAESLKVLSSEIKQNHPDTIIWAIGNEAHQATWSDHNPNSAGVVCAIDVLPNGGLNLGLFVETITRVDPPALKYVIFNRGIWFPQVGWQPYRGSNPHTGHVHVSVGRGPDGRSSGPYDDLSAWGVAKGTPEPGSGLRDDFKEALMALPLLSEGAKGKHVGVLQGSLLAWGYDLGKYGPRRNGIDNHFGPATDRAVRDFQVKRKVPNSVRNGRGDGKVGPQTRIYLARAN